MASSILVGAGFALLIVHGILDCVRELEAGKHGVRNAYASFLPTVNVAGTVSVPVSA